VQTIVLSKCKAIKDVPHSISKYNILLWSMFFYTAAKKQGKIQNHADKHQIITDIVVYHRLRLNSTPNWTYIDFRKLIVCYLYRSEQSLFNWSSLNDSTRLGFISQHEKDKKK